MISNLPRNYLLLAAAIVGIVSPILVLIFGFGFTALGVHELPLSAYVVFKGVYGGLLGAAVAYIVLARHLSIEVHKAASK
jgi:hypothetical protein